MARRYYNRRDLIGHWITRRQREQQPCTHACCRGSLAGAAVNKNSFNVGWRAALDAAKMPRQRENGFHALRHYFASVLLADGVDVRTLSEYLGHHDPGFTLRTYTHLMPSAPDRVRAAVDRAFAEPAAPARSMGAQ